MNVSDMRARNIYLTGFMGCGKSTVGRVLAARLGRGFLDTDQAVARRARRPIPRIFKELGEPAFRRFEEDAVRDAAGMRGLVVALGGGALLSYRNQKLVGLSGTTIYLECPEKTLFRRCAGEGRPLAMGPASLSKKRLRALLAVRKQGYLEADITVSAGRTPSQVVQAIMRKLKTPKNILVLHGPNLNVLGARQPDIYGNMTLAELNGKLKNAAKRLRIKLKIFQSNHEGSLIDHIHKNGTWTHGILINPAAYTHTSIALRDAIEGSGLPAVEVHLTNIRKRESFRRKSVIAPVCEAQFMGKGWLSYLEGLRFLAG